MKPKQIGFRSMLLIAWLFCLSTPLSADEESDHAALREIKAAYEEAVNTSTPGKIAPYLSPMVTGVMVTGEEVRGFHELETYWKKIQELIGPGGTYQVAVRADKTEFFGNMAVSRGSTDDRVKLPNGKEFQFTSFWTAVCQKEDGQWKVLRMQATMDPVDNIVVTTRLHMTKLMYGGAGFALGIVVLLVYLFLRLRTSKK